jgi:hypothetical protein
LLRKITQANSIRGNVFQHSGGKKATVGNVDRDVVERNAGMPPFITRPRLCSIGDVLRIVPGGGGGPQGRS